MRSPAFLAALIAVLVVSTGRSDDKDIALPGAKGPLWEYVGKEGTKVTGADVGATINAPNPDKPPKTRSLPSGIKKLYIAVTFEIKPQAESITMDVYTKDGKLEVGTEVYSQDRNKATGGWNVLLIRNPKDGKYDDGPYQAKVKLDDKIAALVNWEIGKAKK